MPREARLFDSANGSPIRALSRLQGNIPPNWIGRARRSRKDLEPDLVAAMNKVRNSRWPWDSCCIMRPFTAFTIGDRSHCS
jgi:hypothetical protein